MRELFFGSGDIEDRSVVGLVEGKAACSGGGAGHDGDLVLGGEAPAGANGAGGGGSDRDGHIGWPPPSPPAAAGSPDFFHQPAARDFGGISSTDLEAVAEAEGGEEGLETRGGPAASAPRAHPRFHAVAAAAAATTAGGGLKYRPRGASAPAEAVPPVRVSLTSRVQALAGFAGAGSGGGGARVSEVSSFLSVDADDPEIAEHRLKRVRAGAPFR